jgi:predicted TIM-barrel fold metal-dependent hydrolase
VLWEGKVKIIDGQVHEITPWLDWKERDIELQHEAFMEVALAFLDAIGVDAVVLFTSEEWGATAAAHFPDRLAYVPNISPDEPDVEAAVADARAKHSQGLLALRAIVGWPFDGSEATRLENGGWDPIFRACEEKGVPVFIFISGWLPLAAGVAERFPNLTLIIDHVGLPQPPIEVRDVPPFKSLPQLLDLAKFPNVAVKLCGLPSLSNRPFPYEDVVTHLRTITDTFGADRLMWASDIGRFYGRIGLTLEIPGARGDYEGKHTYAESLNFIRYCDSLTDDEKQAILGGTLTRLLGWP